MYNDENDYELLYLISESNEEAKEVFFEKYKPTVQSYVLKYYPFIKNKGYEIVPVSQIIYTDNYHINSEGKQIKNEQ